MDVKLQKSLQYVALGATDGVQTVIIQGEVHVRDGIAIRRGTIET
jgi:hypothetical protein